MAPTTDETGRVVAEKYRLRRIIGEGGMGVVYAATHLWTDREVAVKVLHPYYARDEVTVHRFMREARAAARLHHPHVVDVLDMGQREDGSVYMVMEMLVGETLADRLRRDGPLDAPSALEVVLPIMDALAIAHERGIVHRDLKPDNLFLSHDRVGKTVPKLLDFGIAKMQAQGGSETEAGSIVGTPAYMSPEQIRGVAIGPKADIWSIGVVLYEALSGKLPFGGETPTGILAAILTEELPPLGSVAPHVPAPLATVIDRALQKDAALRPESMRDLEELLFAAAAEAHIALEGRISRVEWDPSMAETGTESIGKGLQTVSKTLAPIASGAAWAFAALAVVGMAMGVGLYVGLQRPWGAEGERAGEEPHAPTLVDGASKVEVAARPPRAPDGVEEGVAAPHSGAVDAGAAQALRGEPPAPERDPSEGRDRRDRARGDRRDEPPRSPATSVATAAEPTAGPSDATDVAPEAAPPPVTPPPPPRDTPARSTEPARTTIREDRMIEDDLIRPDRWRSGSTGGS